MHTDPTATAEAAARAQLEQLDPATRQAVTDAEARLEQLQRSTTQRDWLLITQALNRTRNEVVSDGGLRLLALAFVKEKRDHGGANWDVLLDMTDEQLLELHGFPDLEGTSPALEDVAPAEGERDYSAQVTPPPPGAEGDPHRP